MAVVDTDISVAANGDIRWTGNATDTYTVLEFHRWLQLKAYGASASGDDFLDIVTDTPSDRSTDNIIRLLGSYNIDDTMATHLFDGSIRQGTGGTEVVYSGIRILGSVNNTNTQIEIAQNGALIASTFWGDQSTGGWNGDATAGILARFMIKSFDSGAAIDGQRVRVQIRHWGDTYDFFNVQLGDGEAVGAVSSTPDAQNDTLQATVTAYTHVTNTEGYQTIDLNNGNGAQPYYSQWTYGADTSGDGLKGMWEFIKDLSGNGTAKTIHGINGELFLGVTHEYAYDTETGNSFIENDVITWGSGATAGTGLLLALNDTGTTGTVWIQLLTGVAPTDGETINNEAADGTHDVNGAVTARTVPKVFLGSYTGNLIGAFGIGVASSDVTSNDTLKDLLNADQTPPNNVTFSVTGLDFTGGLEDRVVVTSRAAGVIEKDQLSASGAQASGLGTLTVSTTIPSDTPASGTVRPLGDLGVYNDVAYTSYSGAVFTLTGTLPDDVSNLANVFITYIDKLAGAASEAFTVIYLANRDLFVRVRNGNESVPIKTFDAPAQLTANGGTIAAIRTPDI